ncbi:hypothetical protein [Nocardia tengchongensis]|uniref:Secreted protein n=1 Tax=Nocardia tengchongensis TaxID=2055889 RepID=A0ABX8CX46_9NOCA|nr:hypothetical protein [Nocardia tengchongensis]QVI24457.1 hypothetical protein KHQ06_18055 [Nocardia tengchongensis]
MNTMKTSRYAAMGVAIAAAAAGLSIGTATAATGPVSIWIGPGPDLLSCKATTQKCAVTAYTSDMSTPVTITVNGKTIASGVPVPSSGTAASGQFSTMWVPQTVGTNTVTVAQGGNSDSATLQIMDNNSPEAFAQRTEAFLQAQVCKTGSSSMSAGCMNGTGGVH